MGFLLFFFFFFVFMYNRNHACEVLRKTYFTDIIFECDIRHRVTSGGSEFESKIVTRVQSVYCFLFIVSNQKQRTRCRLVYDLAGD